MEGSLWDVKKDYFHGVKEPHCIEESIYVLDEVRMLVDSDSITDRFVCERVVVHIDVPFSHCPSLTHSQTPSTLLSLQLKN